MPVQTPTPPSLPAELFDLLACPACQGRLRDTGDGLSCTHCERPFPIVDGIPILLVDRASQPGPQ